MSHSPILEVQHISKTYPSGTRSLTVLNDISFSVFSGETCAIVGPSGSGKSTLLGLCAGLDRPTSGTIRINGTDINPLDEDERAQLRNQYIGFVFQTFQLLPTLTALENVMVPLELRNERNIAGRAEELLEQVGLGDRLDHYPTQLSGGEQQRVAIARAFINRPRLLFADEPTGNLDTETSGTIIDLLFDLNRHHETTLVLVTHDMSLARRTGRMLKLTAGNLEEEQINVAQNA